MLWCVNSRCRGAQRSPQARQRAGGAQWRRTADFKVACRAPSPLLTPPACFDAPLHPCNAILAWPSSRPAPALLNRPTRTGASTLQASARRRCATPSWRCATRGCTWSRTTWTYAASPPSRWAGHAGTSERPSISGAVGRAVEQHSQRKAADGSPARRFQEGTEGAGATGGRQSARASARRALRCSHLRRLRVCRLRPAVPCRRWRRRTAAGRSTP